MITGLTGMCGFFLTQNPNGRLNEPTTSTNGSESQCEFKEIHLNYWVEQLDACLRLVQKGRLSALIFHQKLFETLLAYPTCLICQGKQKGFCL